MMIEPRQKTLSMLGLGTSIGTPQEGIEAEVLVVRSFDELKAKKDQVTKFFSKFSNVQHIFDQC